MRKNKVEFRFDSDLRQKMRKYLERLEITEDKEKKIKMNEDLRDFKDQDQDSQGS